MNNFHIKRIVSLAAVFFVLLIIISAIYYFYPRMVTNKSRYSVDFYTSIEPNTPFKDIVAEIGEPDKDIGSGIHIFVYKLSPCHEIWLGYPDLNRLLYIKEKLCNGLMVDLRSEVRSF